MRRSRRTNKRERIDRLASRQHGRVQRSQLFELGLTQHEVDGLVERRELFVEYRGVYAVRHVSRTLAGRAMSAVLATGPGALASFETAAHLLGWLPGRPDPAAIDVSTGSPGRRSRDGLRVHFCDRLTPADCRIVDGVPATSPARTLLDLASGAAEDVFEAAFDEAMFRRRLPAHQIADILLRNAGRAGTARLRSIHRAEAGGERNRLEAEKRLARLIAAAKLPRPQANVRIGRHVVDFLWPNQRFIVEMDGFATHSSRAAFESDRARDAELQSLGYVVMRVTWRQLTREPAAVVARLAAGLVQRR